MFTDETKLKFGKYKNKKLCDIPNEYLIALYQSNYYNDEHKELIEYIENKNILNPLQSKKKFVSDTIGYKIAGSFVKLICKGSDKIIFTSESDAKFEINRIRNLKQDNKKPVRAYECEKCGGWHLTSISFEIWEKQ